MQSFKIWIEANMENGFWTGSGGKGASGILAISQSGRICFALRSASTHSRVGGQTVHKQCWGTIGGAIDEGSPLESAKKEVEEESGFTGPYLKVFPGYVFRSATFTYYNFIVLVEKEFEFNPQSDSHWETDGLQWINYEDVVDKTSYGGYPMHDGLVALLRDPASKKIIEDLLNFTNNFG